MANASPQPLQSSSASTVAILRFVVLLLLIAGATCESCRVCTHCPFRHYCRYTSDRRDNPGVCKPLLKNECCFDRYHADGFLADCLHTQFCHNFYGHNQKGICKDIFDKELSPYAPAPKDFIGIDYGIIFKRGPKISCNRKGVCSGPDKAMPTGGTCCGNCHSCVYNSCCNCIYTNPMVACPIPGWRSSAYVGTVCAPGSGVTSIGQSHC